MKEMKFPCPCTYKGEGHMITTKRKDFSTKKMYYRLEKLGNEDIPVEDVTLGTGAPKGASKKDLELIAMRTAYKGIFGKDVPNNKKNNAEWIQGKIEEAHEAAPEEITEELLNGMDLDELKKVIFDKELSIDPEDYLISEEPENLSYLCEAIWEELNRLAEVE